MLFKLKTEIQWAIIFSIMTLIWMGMEKLVGLHDLYVSKHAIYTNFYALPSIAIYILALFAKRKTDYEGKISYKQAFLSGMILTLFITILSPITQVLTSMVISPQYFANAIKYTVEKEIMTAADASNYFSLKNYIILGITGAPIMGILTTSFVAIFVKNIK
jgi:hypothetical protein